MQPPPAGHTHVLIQREALGTLTQMKRTVPALRAKAHQLRIAALRTAPHLHSAEGRSRSNCADRDNNGRHASNAFNGCSLPSVRNHYVLPTIQDEGVNKRAISMPRANNGNQVKTASAGHPNNRRPNARGPNWGPSHRNPSNFRVWPHS
jgi:hypothetical protein